ncbi:MAG: FAD-dependent oxidoreductase [Nitrospirota bacterium]|jgi:thioredoxin reductase (NADPH)
MAEDLYDVIIIGGGPAGLSAAQYAARSRLRTIVLDRSETAGALAYTNRIENYPGVTEPLSGKELLERFRKQAVDFGAEYQGDTQVVGVKLDGLVKEVFTLDKTYLGKTVIVATGSMGRKAAIQGEAEFLGRGVSYCAICDAAFFKGKTVCVLGDSEEAAKEAGLLSKYAGKVYLISPIPKLKVESDYPALQADNVEVVLGRKVTAIMGDEAVEKIRTKDTKGNESELGVAGVFVYIHGSRPIVDFLAESVHTSDNECVVVNRMMETTVQGVFAGGDVTCTEVRQVVIAASNGCIAALSAEKYIAHRKRRKLDWH